MLEMKNVTKTFGNFKALDDLTLTVPSGRVYGLVGPQRRRQVHRHPAPHRHLPPGQRQRHHGQSADL